MPLVTTCGCVEGVSCDKSDIKIELYLRREQIDKRVRALIRHKSIRNNNYNQLIRSKYLEKNTLDITPEGLSVGLEFSPSHLQAEDPDIFVKQASVVQLADTQILKIYTHRVVLKSAKTLLATDEENKIKKRDLTASGGLLCPLQQYEGHPSNIPKKYGTIELPVDGFFDVESDTPVSNMDDSNIDVFFTTFRRRSDLARMPGETATLHHSGKPRAILLYAMIGIDSWSDQYTTTMISGEVLLR